MSTTGELRFGRYRLAGPQGPLRAGDGVIALPPKALAMLWTLLRHAGEVVTKEQMLAAVWPKAVVTEGVLSACLRDLRQALDDDPRSPRYIATAHRIGYRFIAAVSSRSTPIAPGARAAAQAAASRFVGRDAELARLHAAFARALGGQRQLVFVSGEAGIGKTSLVDDFVSRLVQARDVADGAGSPTPSAAGLRVAGGQCIDHYGVGEPYLPVLEALSRLCRQAGGSDLVALLRRYAPTWLVQLPGLLDEHEYAALQLKVAGSTVERMLREMVEALEAATAEEPLVLIFEDMHWSDRSTVDWLAMLARRPEPARLLVIATCRPVELIVSNHPLKAVRQELVSRGAAMEVLLGYLTADAVQAYVERRLPDRAELLASAVYRHSQGHPLFMVHVADDLDRQGAARSAVESADRMVIEAAMPSGVLELIEVQLARLDQEQQAALEAASVAGAEFAAASVAAALQVAPEQAERALEALVRREQFVEARGLAEWHDGTVSGRYGFRHDLYREALYRRLGAARRVQLHARIGQRLALAHGERAGEIATELGLHFERAKNPGQAARYCREAGETALRRYAYREALAHVDKGLALLRAAGPGHEPTELLLRLTQGAALLVTSGYAAPQVEETYLRAQALSLLTGDTGAMKPVLSGLWNLYLTRAAFARAREIADDLFELAQRRPEPVLSMLAHNSRGTGLLFTGHPAAALTHIEPSRALYDLRLHRLLAMQYGEDPGVACQHYATLTRWLLGYPEAALRHLEQGLELARALAHPFGEAQMLWMEAVICLDGGDLDRLDKATQRLIPLCIDNDFPLWLAGGLILRGGLLAGRGQCEQGLAQAHQGLQQWRAMGTLLTLPHALAVVASAYAMSGRIADALHMLAEAQQTAHRTGELWYEAELYRLEGELTLQQAGRSDVERSQARACFERAIDIARQQQARLLELRASLSLARLWQRQGEVAAARSMLTAICSSFTEGFESRDLKDAAALLATLAMR